MAAWGGVVVAAALTLGGVAPELLIRAPAGMESDVARVRVISNSDFGNILRMTGQVGFVAPITVVLAPEDSELARSTPSWVSGYARGDRSLMVVFPARVRSYPDRDLQTLLSHEIAHIMVYRAARGQPVPRWFNEGVATVAAREWGLEDRARYAAAVIGAGPTTVGELDAGFAGNAQQARRAYALSSAFVRFLQRRWGAQTPAVILAELAEGQSFERAFQAATGSTLQRAEWRFFEREAFWHTWLPFVTSSAAVWMAITTLALLAIVRRRQRSAALRAAWDDQDSAQLAEAAHFLGPSTGDDDDDGTVN